jgi:hypothetical protein
MEEKGLWKSTTCGDATLMCVEAKPFVDLVLEALRSFDEEILWRLPAWDTDAWIEWTKEYKKMLEK